MWPTLFEIPYLEIPIRAYGLMLMIAFLGGTWWAAARAWKVKANPDIVINLGFTALLCSVVGARAFYVIHYWEKYEGTGLWNIVNVSAGGMEFYGGFIGAFIGVLGYLWVKKASFRLYFDIIAPSLMFGMGMARIGCFLNGCCWGAACPTEMTWAVTFPYGSPVQVRQFEQRLSTVPAELLYVRNEGTAFILPRDLLREVGDKDSRLGQRYYELSMKLENKLREGTTSEEIKALRKKQRQVLARWKQQEDNFVPLIARNVSKFDVPPAKLYQMAHDTESRSIYVHPAQLYASIDGFVLAILLSTVFYRRKRQGVVFGLLFLLYPIMRFMEEIIRSDNPHDTAGLTISQFISLVLFLIGVIWMFIVYRLPLRSPKAKPDRQDHSTAEVMSS